MVEIRICDLCVSKGELKEATHYYTLGEFDRWDICDDCVKVVKEAGYTVFPIIEVTYEGNE